MLYLCCYQEKIINLIEMLKVALTHDVDRIDKTFQHITRFGNSIRQLSKYNLSAWLGHLFNPKAYFMIRDLIEIEEKYNVRSTFFFLQESIPFNILRISNWPLSLGYYNLDDQRLRRLYPVLLSGGWEIGLHGSYLSYESSELLSREKELLENVIESPVFGIRQHFLNLSPDTWENQEKAGFKYDASWGYTRNIGFKENKFGAFKPLENSAFTVFPLALMDFCVMAKKEYTKEVIDTIEKSIANEGILVLNWHQRTFNDFEFPGYRRVYEEIINICRDFNATFFTLNSYLTLKNQVV
jgi:peptidoglycan/xylan/chitin deacetylase (PgdA/CDA1 family)